MARFSGRRSTGGDFLLLAAILALAAAGDVNAGKATPSVEAQEARETFRSLFGRDVAKARATPAFDDDLAVAKRLLAVARDATESPAFLSILCDEAYALAAPHAAGEATAAGAMHLLAKHVPDRAEEAKARIRTLRGEAAETPPAEEAAGADEKGPAETGATAQAPASPKAELDALLEEIEQKKEAGAFVEAAALYREAQAWPAASTTTGCGISRRPPRRSAGASASSAGPATCGRCSSGSRRTSPPAKGWCASTS